MQIAAKSPINQSESKQNRPKHRLRNGFLTFCGVFIFSVFFIPWVITIYPERADNLGDEVEYIATDKTICFPSCGDFITTRYYFATTLDENKMRHYFKRAKYSEQESYAEWSGRYKTLSYVNDWQEWGILNYYTKASLAQEKDFVKNPSRKPYVVEMSKEDYHFFKNNLK